MPDETVDLIATKAYPYARIKVAVGDRFTAPVRDAGLLVSIGLATYAPAVTPEPDKPKARIKTRELKPEPTPEPAPQPTAEPLPPPTVEQTAQSTGTHDVPAAQPVRTYKRRD